uniref:Uncharacterized protein n=1 Tax=Strongyloides papillosus TaxID=174720 RepID=A0A0N5C325_STREA
MNILKSSPLGAAISSNPGNHHRNVPRRDYRIEFTNLNTINQNIWDGDDNKYRCICKMVHVTKAALHLAYAQLTIFMMFVCVLAYSYIMQHRGGNNGNGQGSGDQMFNGMYMNHNSNFLFSFSAQMFFVILLIHGIRNEKRSLLIPYIVFIMICVLIGFAQLCTELIGSLSQQSSGSYSPSSFDGKSTRGPLSQPFFAMLIGVLIHAWCLNVVWRCYQYLGDKKLAKSIAEQLSHTQSAFNYPHFGYPVFNYPQPPPYSDVVIGSNGTTSEREPMVPGNREDVHREEEIDNNHSGIVVVHDQQQENDGTNNSNEIKTV